MVDLAGSDEHSDSVFVLDESGDDFDSSDDDDHSSGTDQEQNDNQNKRGLYNVKKDCRLLSDVFEEQQNTFKQMLGDDYSQEVNKSKRKQMVANILQT